MKLYSWNDFDNDVKTIIEKIEDSFWFPDYIVGVKRGGLIPAIKLSHYFDKPLIMMSCQLRDDFNNNVHLLEAEKISRNNKILIVDDICDSGSTFSKIIFEFYTKGHDSVKTCSLVYNTEQPFVINYYGQSIDRSTNKSWILFPWEYNKDL